MSWQERFDRLYKEISADKSRIPRKRKPTAREQETANPLPGKDYTKGHPLEPGQDEANESDSNER